MRYYKKKIILFIAGGSGNQLFQISHFKNIIEKNNYDFKICHILCKKNLFNKITNFKIHENFLNLDLSDEHKSSLLTLIALFILFLKFKIKKRLNKNFVKIKFFRTTYFYGYFQDKLNQNLIEGQRLTENLFPKIDDKNIDQLSNLSIHIREGDFNEKSKLSTNFYIEAIKLLSNKYQKKINKISIIGIYSTEKLYEIRNILTEHFPDHIVETPINNAKNDFKLIWNSNFVISSNSTFSLWSSLYGNSCVVIFPSLFCKYSLRDFKKTIFYV